MLIWTIVGEAESENMCLQVACDDTKLKMLSVKRTRIKLNAWVENALFTLFDFEFIF